MKLPKAEYPMLEKIINDSNHRLNQVLETLQSEFGITLDFADKQSLNDLEAFAIDTVKAVKESESFNQTHKNPQTVCALLVVEAIKIHRENKMEKNFQSKKTKTTKKRVVETTELDKAELLLASKNIVDDLQSMSEKVSKIQAEQLPAIVDRIKLDNGLGDAANYREVTTVQLDAVIAALNTAKETIDNLTLGLSGDVAMANPTDMDTPAPVTAPVDGENADVDTVSPVDAAPQERERKEESRRTIGQIVREGTCVGTDKCACKTCKTKVEEKVAQEHNFIVQVKDGNAVVGHWDVEAKNGAEAMAKAKKLALKHKVTQWTEHHNMEAVKRKSVKEDVVPFPAHKVTPAVTQASPATITSVDDFEDAQKEKSHIDRFEIEQAVYNKLLKPMFNANPNSRPDYDLVKNWVKRNYPSASERMVTDIISDLKHFAATEEQSHQYFGESAANYKQALVDELKEKGAKNPAALASWIVESKKKNKSLVSEAVDTTELGLGDRVKHKTLGKGKVVSCKENGFITVEFEDGKKRSFSNRNSEALIAEAFKKGDEVYVSAKGLEQSGKKGKITSADAMGAMVDFGKKSHKFSNKDLKKLKESSDMYPSDYLKVGDTVIIDNQVRPTKPNEQKKTGVITKIDNTPTHKHGKRMIYVKDSEGNEKIHLGSDLKKLKESPTGKMKENASTGATSAGAVGSIPKPVFAKPIRRNPQESKRVCGNCFAISEDCSCSGGLKEAKIAVVLVVETMKGKKGKKKFVNEVAAKTWLAKHGHHLKSAHVVSKKKKK